MSRTATVTLALIQGAAILSSSSWHASSVTVDRVLLKNERGRAHTCLVTVAEIVFGLLASIVVVVFTLREHARMPAAELTRGA